MGELKKLPIGIEDFSKLRMQDFYFVDKSSLIKELLEGWGEVNLFTRPRRFGKSMNMSMLKAFFEIGCKKELFDGLAISREKRLCADYMGRFPVISISLKGVDGLSFEEAFAAMRNIIGNEAMRFLFLKDSLALADEEKELYRKLIHINQTTGGLYDMTADVVESGLRTLALLLSRHYNQKVIILIDEYDVPLDKASQNGYYDQMVSLLRKIFSNALKTNEDLQFAVLTGCLRISKESIFTGLNNLSVISVTNERFSEYFGFTDREVRDMLDYYGMSRFYEAVKKWYDGYRFGKMNIYCPWDVINYCYEMKGLREKEPEAEMAPPNYWVNTSGNVIIKKLLGKASGRTKVELEQLVAGETLVKRIEENLTYSDLYDSVDNIWSVLFTTGYLTCQGITQQGDYQLCIPNMEIRSIFVSQIIKWFEEETRKEPLKLEALCDAVQRGDAQTFQNSLTEYLRKTISIRDTAVKSPKENFYHGILLGLLSHREDWFIKSNVESGYGYSDILLLDYNTETGIVIEIKYAPGSVLEDGCREALEQIEEKQYDSFLREEGMTTVIKYGIAFFMKKCMVMCEA